ncbi:NHL domain-containing thioredoxin family protein [Pseudonocardia sp. KRD291]|uniref:NHL domain-containing thioredoxin family protein n=1 Tax=Pseudonocardia sp. KRD291 TaxID=2792007 RepID=UPI001C4A28CA|nr:NHL domain-containing thioredoxin family protein [Pseudonocardia sp. KRD291]MBW0102510.1 redoxin domain-containing protein [Pseudonocardia sp. KRD291]
MRVRAPELRGRRWLNTGGEELTLAGLRGRIVVLDFWTFCCVNCLHALDELRPLEEEFGDVLVIIGVHSPKFVHEADPAAVEAAVERYDVTHPVLDDPDLITWDAYAARAWPTLAVIDPSGKVVARMAGEGHGPGLASLVRELVVEHEAAGTLRRGDGPYVAPPAPETALRFPGKIVALPGGTFLVSDTAHHQVVELEADLQTERCRFGTGSRGFTDGSSPRFSEPQGLLVLPPDVAGAAGYDVLVADTVNHALRGLRLGDGDVRTVAGTGAQLRERVLPGESFDATSAELSSPWDLAWWDGRAVVAMAGPHQLWSFDPASGEITVLAGTTNEGLRDGAPDDAFFAQPSGLAVDGDGTLWVADAETSALRRVQRAPAVGAEVGTAVGQGLFEFGHRDGPGAEALLQHPLGVAVLPDGSVAVADTYNGAVRRFDPSTTTVSTLAEGLAEPSDLLIDGDELIVVESAAHRLVRLPIPGGARTDATRVDGAAHRVRRAPTDLSPGAVELRIAFTPPAGQHLDDRFGDPTSLTVAASPPELLLDGAGTSTGLTRTLRLSPDVTDGVLQVAVAAASCDDAGSPGTVDTFAACHRYQQDWGIPVRLVPGADTALDLDLRAV